MAKVIMIQGTTSNAGKSLVTAALCRIFVRDGYRVAPFKSQNMALNSFITDEGLEMGRAQAVQAEAARKAPDVRMNPILLKPTSDKGSQVILNGEVIGYKSAMDYFKMKTEFILSVEEAYRSLAAENDIIVIEGAGSPAEINLKENDIVNMGMAKLANSPVLIVGDIDRGGVFASIYGTYMLQDDTERPFIKGYIINKFRGDLNILMPGIEQFGKLVPVPSVGVIPYMDVKIDDEDSLSDVFKDNGVSDLDIAVIRLPRISNFTDFNAFEILGGIKARYITSTRNFRDPDLLIIPGTKNTVGDLKWMRENGIEAEIKKYAAKGKPVFGICGGFQMLCNKLSDPYNVESGETIGGIGLLDAETIFEKVKTRTRVTGKFENMTGIFSGLNGQSFEGYEIHMGITDSAGHLSTITDANGSTKPDGSCNANVYGSYVHGIFDNEKIVMSMLGALSGQKGIDYDPRQRISIKEFKEQQYDKLADTVRAALDMDYIYKILNEGMK